MVTAALLVGAVLLAAAAALLLPWASRARRLASIPMPEGHWLTGHLSTLKRPDHHLVMRKWADQLGGIYRMRLGPIQAVVVTDPVLIGEALGKNAARLELEKSVDLVYRHFNIVRSLCAFPAYCLNCPPPPLTSHSTLAAKLTRASRCAAAASPWPAHHLHLSHK